MWRLTNTGGQSFRSSARGIFFRLSTEGGGPSTPTASSSIKQSNDPFAASPAFLSDPAQRNAAA